MCTIIVYQSFTLYIISYVDTMYKSLKLFGVLAPTKFFSISKYYDFQLAGFLFIVIINKLVINFYFKLK